MSLAKETKALFRVVLIMMVILNMVDGHAKMTEPPMRSSMWRFGYDTPVNYNDNELFCGGIQRFMKNRGQCGTCGDPYDDPHPEHEAGGRFATGTIVKYYPQYTSQIPVTIDVTAHHKGFFEFRLCAHNNIHKRVSQQCLDQNVLVIEEGEQRGHPHRFFPSDNGLWNVTVRIPPGITCTQCVLQMRYKAGNSWGTGTGPYEGKKGSCLGCGMQEEFRNCADISIGYPEPPSTTTTPVTKTTIPSSDDKQRALNKPLVGWSDSRYLNGQLSSSPSKDQGLKNRLSTGSKLPYTKLGKVTIDTDLPEMDRTMTQQGAGASSKVDVRDYIFRVTRIEEALSLLDDTERVLTGLDTNLAEGGAANNKMPGTHYVKLYAGLVWTRKKISHLEKLIGKIVSRLSLVGSTRRQIRKHNNNDEVYLSEFKATSAIVKDKIQVDSKGNGKIKTRIIKPTSIKEVNRADKSSLDQSITIKPRGKTGKNIVYSNKQVTNPQLSKRITVLHTKTYNSVTSRPAKVQPSTMFTKSTKARAKTESVHSVKEFRKNANILNQVNKGSTQAAKTTLVNKFPVVDSWALRTTSVPRDLTGNSNNIADLSSKSLLKPNRVVPPNSLPWSPEKMPEPVPITRTVTMAHTTYSVKDRKPQTTNSVKDRKPQTINSVKDRKSHTTNSVKDMIAHATNSVKDMQARATNSVKVRKSHTDSSVKDRKSHTANSVKDMKAHATNSVKDMIAHATNSVKDMQAHATNSVKDMNSHKTNSVKVRKSHTDSSVKDRKSHTANSVKDRRSHTTKSVKNLKSQTTNSVKDRKFHATNSVKNRKSQKTNSVKVMKARTNNSVKDMKSHRKHSVKDMNSYNTHSVRDMKSHTQNSFKDMKSRTTVSIKDMKPHTTRNYIKPTFRLKTRKSNALNNYNPKAVVKEMLPTLGALGLTGIPGVSENSRMAPNVVKTMRKINKISRGKKLTLTKWQLAELRNRILHQEYIRANMQRHRQNGNSLLAKR